MFCSRLDWFYFASRAKMNIEQWMQLEVSRALKSGVWKMWQLRKVVIMAMNERWTEDALSWRMDIPDWPKQQQFILNMKWRY